MSDAIITVENLGKKYTLRHAATRARYTALRDVISAGLKRFLKRSGDSSAASHQDEFWALQDVSFNVKQGEVLGIIGRNGAGKSTLLKILSRITEPTKGRITLRGRVASLLEVGTGFHPELTGRENIFLNGAILGMTRAEITRKFDEIVAFAEVERFLDTQVKHYSSGMYVRLAFAVAAHLEPEILIVDEVLAVGDADFQRKCLGQIHKVSRQGRTVLLVSHQMDMITRLATSALLLHRGKIERHGTVSEIVHSYLGSSAGSEARFSYANRASVVAVQLNQERLLSGSLEIAVTFAAPGPITNPTVGIVVSTLGGMPVFGSNTLMHPSASQMHSISSGQAIFLLDCIPLLSGEYNIAVWLSNGMTNLDHLPEALSFRYQDPAPTPYYADPQVQGPCKVTPTWRFDAADSGVLEHPHQKN